MQCGPFQSGISSIFYAKSVQLRGFMGLRRSQLKRPLQTKTDK